MKQLRVLMLLLFLCSSRSLVANQSNNYYLQQEPLADTSSTAWINHFRQLRELLYKADTNGVKSFFQFPVSTDSTEIWYLLRGDAELNPATAFNNKPFTEKEFKKYFGKLFPPAFIKCLLKIKTATLLQTGRAESPELLIDKDETVKLYVVYNKEERLLSLNLSSRYIMDEPGGDAGESSVLYEFHITDNGQLIFKRIKMAG